LKAHIELKIAFEIQTSGNMVYTAKKMCVWHTQLWDYKQTRIGLGIAVGIEEERASEEEGMFNRDGPVMSQD
jgi:hypothetical protein